jgi:Druantia protein DruA
MDVVLRYRGRIVQESDLVLIRHLIQEHPAASRRELSEKLCQAWNWVQANGAACDMVCRGLMLALDRAGHITLPAVKGRPPNPLAVRRKPCCPEVDTSPIECRLKDLGPLEFRLVRRTADEVVFNGLIEHYHYLRYSQPVGEHIKYMIWAGDRPIACVAWSSAPRHLGPRDRFIGWTAEARRRNIRYIAYQTRYLILPWVRVKLLASHILGQMAARVPGDWQRMYGHGIYYLETFVDPERARGICYKAANWIELGLTTGRGKASNGHRPNRSLKQVLGYPLRRDFRRRLMDTA